MTPSRSGLPALYSALSDRIAEGVGREAIERAAKSAVNLAQSVKAATDAGRPPGDKAPELLMSREVITRELDAIGARALRDFDAAFEQQIESYHARLDRSHRSFLERATASLIDHLDRHGEKEVWKYEPTGLRLLLRSAYQVFGAKIQGASRKVFESTAEDFTALYTTAFRIEASDFRIAPPTPSRPAALTCNTGEAVSPGSSGAEATA